MNLADVMDLFPDKIGSDEVIRSFMADDRVNRIVANNAMKNGLISDKEEVKHDVAVTFYDNYLRSPGKLCFPKKDHVYSLVYKIADLTCKERSRKNATDAANGVFLDNEHEDYDGETFNGIIISTLSPSAELQLIDSGFEDRCIENVDQQSAIDEFCRKIGNMKKETANHILLPGISRSNKQWSVLVKKAPTTRSMDALPKDHRELNDIKKKLGLTQPDFAVALDINPATLASYLYGKTVSVPENIMALARKLLLDGEKKMLEIEAKFERPMQDILKEWCDKLCIKNGDEIDSLADYLKVNSITVRRWFNGENRPKLKDLVRYDRMVNKLAESFA